jgi:hypothetical protein
MAGEKSVRRSQVGLSLPYPPPSPPLVIFLAEADFSPLYLLAWNKVKYFSPITNLGNLRHGVARGAAANTTWAALVFLDRVGGGNSAEGHKVVPHVIHVSGASCLLPLVFSFFF